MSRAILTLAVDEKFCAELRVSANLDGFEPAKRALLRAAVEAIASQCNAWRIDFTELLTPSERAALLKSLERHKA